MDYITIRNGEEQSYGGNQLWLSGSRLSSYGCGVIAISDIILYLFYHNYFPEDVFCSFFSKQGVVLSKNQQEKLEMKTYTAYIELMEKNFFPISKLAKGVTGIRLMNGFNRCADKFEIPYRAVWAVQKEQVFSCIQGMLRAEIPALLSVGPNVPRFWQNKKIPFYQKDSNGNYQKAGMINSHYITVLEVEVGVEQSRMLGVSSWGKKYYINWEEYIIYINRNSWAYFNNILLLQKKEPVQKQEWSFGME